MWFNDKMLFMEKSLTALPALICIIAITSWTPCAHMSCDTSHHFYAWGEKRVLPLRANPAHRLSVCVCSECTEPVSSCTQSAWPNGQALWIVRSHFMCGCAWTYGCTLSVHADTWFWLINGAAQNSPWGQPVHSFSCVYYLLKGAGRLVLCCKFFLGSLIIIIIVKIINVTGEQHSGILYKHFTSIYGSDSNVYYFIFTQSTSRIYRTVAHYLPISPEIYRSWHLAARCRSFTLHVHHNKPATCTSSQATK